ncbi:MAG TPA: tryptophan--tRNA ligase [Candidatus Marinimicrobia bacterium]|nr:tryptophan--tRNA ligase [Candidatus Neomarinimicrobiota bacterium]HRS51646.1 tryptophan--tRNA ligase [Candidatus Neomarinimicrobiota bacterium]HRU92204.1 tryptophan--tRNA ligase [Candidatus Neomarinimicrobiota bacterium]
MENRKVKGRILSGMRPTGKMHLGNYVGALENWVKLQEEYENYHLIADYHALTTNLDTSELFSNTIEMVYDWLAVGIDPQRSPIFRQSQVKEHCELFLIFAMLITTARLERNPTLKEQVRDLNIGTLSFGHLGYPVLQAADILIYKANLVPVGEDQVPHVEITREIARKFNQTWGKVFPIPEAKLTKFARLPGLDGNKMSKSVGNTILLADSDEEINSKIKKAITDPQKIRRGDPGRPEICLVYTYHKKFNNDQCPEIYAGCTSGALGCVECKMKCGAAIQSVIAPYRSRRMYYAAHQSEVIDILIDGERRARQVAQSTMADVHNKMKIG